MQKQMNKISVITALLWAIAVVAAAIVKAPGFFTVILLPMLAFLSLATIQTIGRRAFQ